LVLRALGRKPLSALYTGCKRILESTGAIIGHTIIMVIAGPYPYACNFRLVMPATIGKEFNNPRISNVPLSAAFSSFFIALFTFICPALLVLLIILIIL